MNGTHYSEQILLHIQALCQNGFFKVIFIVMAKKNGYRNSIGMLAGGEFHMAFAIEIM